MPRQGGEDAQAPPLPFPAEGEMLGEHPGTASPPLPSLLPPGKRFQPHYGAAGPCGGSGQE